MILIDAANICTLLCYNDVIVSVNLIDIKNRFVSSKTTQLRKDADICAMGRGVH